MYTYTCMYSCIVYVALCNGAEILQFLEDSQYRKQCHSYMCTSDVFPWLMSQLHLNVLHIYMCSLRWCYGVMSYQLISPFLIGGVISYQLITLFIIDKVYKVRAVLTTCMDRLKSRLLFQFELKVSKSTEKITNKLLFVDHATACVYSYDNREQYDFWVLEEVLTWETRPFLL